MNNRVILSIDTTLVDTSKVSIKMNNKIRILRRKSKINKAQNTLILIQNILVNNNLKFSNINKIFVNTGQGSLVGIRVGLTIANTLGYLLQVPVNGTTVPALQ